MSAPTLPERTITLVVGALGGEGGGVLADWVVKAAESQNFPVQSTSIPGVAQRTGATTYYIELYPVSHEALGGRRPVMAMYQTPGNMDVVVSSELMEAGRAIENGMVTPERTTLIASTHRVFSILERSAMGNELFEGDDVIKAANRLAKRAILFDAERLVNQTGAAINAVLLGVIAGSGELPLSEEAFEEGVRRAGVAVEPNLAGFRAGLAYVRGELALEPAAERPSKWGRRARIDDLVSEVESGFPPETHLVLTEGVRRVVDYQNAAYGAAYLARARSLLEADKANGAAGRGFRLTIEAGRYLALWMSYEDIIRVADLKSRPERMARIREEAAARAGEPVRVTEFLKPGWDEIASVLPPAMGRRLAAWKDGNEARRDFHFAMRVRTDGVFGYLRLWLLARMKWWRPRSFRFADEQAEIGSWLEAVIAAAPRGYDLALEIAELPRLHKGYSDTLRRGTANYRRVFEALALPAAQGTGEPASQANAIRAARTAALADEEGKALDAAMDRIATPEAPRAAAE